MILHGLHCGRAGCYVSLVPLYDYACQQCGREFEFLVRAGDTSAPQCPNCHSTSIERLLSSFAVSSEATRKASFSKAKEKNLKVARGKAMEEERAIHHAHDDDHH